MKNNNTTTERKVARARRAIIAHDITDEDIKQDVYILSLECGTAQDFHRKLMNLLATCQDFVNEVPIEELTEDEAFDLAMGEFAKSNANLTNSLLSEELEKQFSRLLTDRELLLIKYRFYNRMTLVEAGKLLGVSRETARMLEAKALRKLRMPSSIKQLQGFLEP